MLRIQEKYPNNNNIYGEYINFENVLFYFYNILGEKNDPLNYVESQSSSVYINDRNLRKEIPLYENIKEHLFSNNNNNPIKENNKIELYLSTKALLSDNSYFCIVSKNKSITVDTVNLNKIVKLN